MAVRVMRLMEYTYPSIEVADEDISHWGMPPNSVRRYGEKIIRSTIILDPFPLPQDLEVKDGPSSSNRLQGQ